MTLLRLRKSEGRKDLSAGDAEGRKEGVCVYVCVCVDGGEKLVMRGGGVAVEERAVAAVVVTCGWLGEEGDVLDRDRVRHKGIERHEV